MYHLTEFFVEICYACVVMITIAEIQKRLRNAIEYGNMTQKELAKQLGVNPSTISKYMRTNKYPSLDTFANLCEILDISADEILGINR